MNEELPSVVKSQEEAELEFLAARNLLEAPVRMQSSAIQQAYIDREIIRVINGYMVVLDES